MFIRKGLFFISLLCVSTQSFSNIFLQTGLHFGGDTLADASFAGGSSESIEAGGLISASVGYQSDISDALLIKLSFGLKLDVISAENGDIDFTRYPITAMLFNKGEKFSFGAGLTQHTGVELSGSGFASFSTVEFDDATGLVLQLDYTLNDRSYISLTYTSIDYNPVNTTEEIDGSSLGLLIGLHFGK